EVPRWLEAVDRARPAHAAAIGLAVAAINLKNLALTVSGSGEIARAEVGPAARAAALAALVAGISAGAAAAVALYAAAPGRGAPLLARLRAWLELRGRWVLVAVCLLAGLGFLARALL
ncbi:MAG TPA: GAP family protein, partial [Capillimicrobium sp.]